MKRKRVKLTPAEIQEHLNEQISFLRASCRLFDEGDEIEAKRIAGVLRTILHNTAQSRALLAQLRKRFNWKFADSAIPFNELNAMTHHGLAGIKISNTPPKPTSRFVPLCGENEKFHPFVPFLAWWKAVVFKDQRGNRFSRKDIVLTVANQDGGAHVDPELDEDYDALSKKNTLGWTFKSGDAEIPWPSNPVPASIRQIAHEVLVTLEAAELVAPMQNASESSETVMNNSPP